jgi:hypothetical protein
MVPTEMMITITDENLSKTVRSEFWNSITKVKDWGYIKE